MRVVDLRSLAVRYASGRWERHGAAGRDGDTAWWRRVLAWPADAWMARRVAARPAPSAPPWVVSVGNLALGGTGKTPVTAALARALAERGRRGAVVSRGFGSPLAGPLIVAASDRRAGDETRLLARVLTPLGWPVIQARRRREGLALLAREHPELDIVLLEDGHQTAHVGRHLDVVILDRWQESPAASGESRVVPTTGAVFPWGPWRESARGARRADVWLLETAAPPDGAANDDAAVVGFRRDYHLAWPEGMPTDGARTALLSGIARPRAFEAAAQEALVSTPCLVLRCDDHVDYDDALLARIRRELASQDITAVVTTAKDLIKLADVWGDGPPLITLEMELRWTGTTALPDLVEERLDAVRDGVSR